MPKNRTGGRHAAAGGSSTTTTTTQQSVTSSNTNGTMNAQSQQPQAQAPQQQATPAVQQNADYNNLILQTGPTNYMTVDDNLAGQIRALYDGFYDPSQKDAIKRYIADNTKRGGVMYSYSQTLNHKINNGLALDANEQFMVKYLDLACHPLGVDMKLTRYAHQDMFGYISKNLNPSKLLSMTSSQLNAALSGIEYVEAAYSSTSYDVTKNPLTHKEVVLNIKAKRTARGFFGKKNQTEIVLARQSKMKITGARFTGKTGTYQGIRYKQIELDIEVE